jgi:hypothetical protein
MDTSKKFFQLEKAEMLLLLADNRQRKKFIRRLKEHGIEITPDLLIDPETGARVRRHECKI